MSKQSVFCIAKDVEQVERDRRGVEVRGLRAATTSPSSSRTRRARATSRTSITPRRPRALRPAPRPEAPWEAVSAGWSASARSRSRASDRSSPPVRSWRRSAAPRIGAAVGGLTGALVGMGIPEFEAKRYEGKIREGGALISVHTEDADERSRAKDIFKRAGAEDIAATSEASPPRS